MPVASCTHRHFERCLQPCRLSCHRCPDATESLPPTLPSRSNDAWLSTGACVRDPPVCKCDKARKRHKASSAKHLAFARSKAQNQGQSFGFRNFFPALSNVSRERRTTDASRCLISTEYTPPTFEAAMPPPISYSKSAGLLCNTKVADRCDKLIIGIAMTQMCIGSVGRDQMWPKGCSKASRPA